MYILEKVCQTYQGKIIIHFVNKDGPQNLFDIKASLQADQTVLNQNLSRWWHLIINEQDDLFVNSAKQNNV